MNIKINVYSLLGFMSAITCFSEVAAQDARPSLEETLSWMDATYNNHSDKGGAWGHGVEEIFSRGQLIKRRTSSFTYDGCRLTVINQDDPASKLYEDLYTYRKTTFLLRYIDPQIKTYLRDPQRGGLPCEPSLPEMACTIAEVELLTYNQMPLMEEEFKITYPKLHGSEHERSDKTNTYVTTFFIDDAEYAKRFVNALRNVISLCGGKPSPF